LDIAKRSLNNFCCLPQEGPSKQRELDHNRHISRPVFLNFRRAKNMHAISPTGDGIVLLVGRRSHGELPWGGVCAK